MTSLRRTRRKRQKDRVLDQAVLVVVEATAVATAVEGEAVVVIEEMA
jgi:hypothetical protein